MKLNEFSSFKYFRPYQFGAASEEYVQSNVFVMLARKRKKIKLTLQVHPINYLTLPLAAGYSC